MNFTASSTSFIRIAVTSALEPKAFVTSISGGMRSFPATVFAPGPVMLASLAKVRVNVSFKALEKPLA